MTQPIAIAAIPLGGLSKIADLLSLLAQIRAINAPLTSADGLKQTLTLLLQLADELGIDPTWTNKLSAILSDPAVFNVVLAILQYLSGLAGAAQSDNTIRVPTTTGVDTTVDAASFVAWLPLLLQLMSLLAQIRGNQ